MANMLDVKTIWVFTGPKANFPSGVFSSRDSAEEWIKKRSLSGPLTRYPVDVSAYDWAISKSYFKPSKEEHSTSDFIARFSSASQEHFHYENGTLA
jgi:hypothetical protein